MKWSFATGGAASSEAPFHYNANHYSQSPNLTSVAAHNSTTKQRISSNQTPD